MQTRNSKGGFVGPLARLLVHPSVGPMHWSMVKLVIVKIGKRYYSTKSYNENKSLTGV